MELPFSHEAFLDVFGAYNSALWPAGAVLWLATAWLALNWIRRGHVDGRLLFALMAVHWAWSGVVYHWLFFRAIASSAASCSRNMASDGEAPNRRPSGIRPVTPARMRARLLAMAGTGDRSCVIRRSRTDARPS